MIFLGLLLFKSAYLCDKSTHIEINQAAQYGFLVFVINTYLEVG